MINKIRNHTNIYAYEHITEEINRNYAQPDGSWQEATSVVIKRLIALLIWSCQSWHQSREILEYKVTLPWFLG